jgi:hypothetical protein
LDVVVMDAPGPFHRPDSDPKEPISPQNTAEEPGNVGTSWKTPQLTNLAHGLHVHARNLASGLALAQALV